MSQGIWLVGKEDRVDGGDALDLVDEPVRTSCHARRPGRDRSPSGPRTRNGALGDRALPINEDPYGVILEFQDWEFIRYLGNWVFRYLKHALPNP